MTFTPENALVWCEIPVLDIEKAMAFYDTVFQYETILDESSPNAVAFLPMTQPPGTAGHLYEGKPASDGRGPTVHLAVPGTVEEAAGRCQSAGGKVAGPVIEIPAGRFQYAVDPDGNSLGLFEGNK